MASATWKQVRARRVDRSSLAARARGEDLVDVVRELCGVHAQVQASAELQLATRVGGITQADVREALWERRSLVKAWTPRGTLHLHPADDLALWFAARRALTAAKEPEGLEAWRDPEGVLHPPLGVDEIEATRSAVRDALDGRCLLRADLAQEVGDRIGPAARRRLLSGFAFFLDELCQGPPQGARITLARPDQWIAGWRELDEQDALLQVCRKYLRTYGPSRPAEFREWFGPRTLELAEARALFESLGEELEEVDVSGRSSYVLAGDTVFPKPRRHVRLLPEYDVYVMGFREREQLVPEAVREQIAAHGRGRYEGPAGVRLLVVDGVAAGLWERKNRGKRIELRVAPAQRLASGRRKDLDREAERIGAFLGLDLVLEVD